MLIQRTRTENKNLKDYPNDLGIVIKDTSVYISYIKTDKLITALYMVTDIIDAGEPLRNKLRTLGTGIISDMNSNPANVFSKISEIMSFLNIASAINIISEMNCNILSKEFLELERATKESVDKVEDLGNEVNLAKFFTDELSLPQASNDKGHYKSIGHHISTRIGVQKGSTLMHALSDRNLVSSVVSNKNQSLSIKTSFYILKKQRRDSMLDIIKTLGGSGTIKDIKDKIVAMPKDAGSLISCGEKTIQRELVSMVKDGVLDKTGKKRWSRYFLSKKVS